MRDLASSRRRSHRVAYAAVLALQVSCNSILGVTDLSHEPTLCGNGVLDPGETDVDCGGPGCGKCANGAECQMHGDCKVKFCSAQTGLCTAPSCKDKIRNGAESGIDCGGGGCALCEFLGQCDTDGNCSKGKCKQGLCVDALCGNGTKDGQETDLDCGGISCVPCSAGKLCKAPDDCSSAGCEDGRCSGASCADGQMNGSETDKDCGGDCPARCAMGGGCKSDGDCASAVCTTNQCQSPSCNDQRWNGGETGIDCGGPCPACQSPCVPCDDHDLCTFDDMSCDSTNGCKGTPISCASTGWDCSPQGKCNGTSACLASFPGLETPCGVSDPCSLGDSGGQCDGKGNCVALYRACWFDPVNKRKWEDPPVTNKMTFDDAKAHCSKLQGVDSAPWMLPTIDELRSLIRGCWMTEMNGPCHVTDACASWFLPCNTPECSSPSCPVVSDPAAPPGYWDPALWGAADVTWSRTQVTETASGEFWTVQFQDATLHSMPKTSLLNVRCVQAN